MDTEESQRRKKRRRSVRNLRRQSGILPSIEDDVENIDSGTKKQPL